MEQIENRLNGNFWWHYLKCLSWDRQYRPFQSCMPQNYIKLELKLDMSILLLSPNPTRKAQPDLQLWASLQPSREYDFLFNFCNCALYNCDLIFFTVEINFFYWLQRMISARAAQIYRTHWWSSVFWTRAVQAAATESSNKQRKQFYC